LAQSKKARPERLNRRGTGGSAYVWLTWIPVAGMLLVALQDVVNSADAATAEDATTLKEAP
jgi:hypothetical protein